LWSTHGNISSHRNNSFSTGAMFRGPSQTPMPMKIWRRCSGSPIPVIADGMWIAYEVGVVDLAANKRPATSGWFPRGRRAAAIDARRRLRHAPRGRPTVNRWRSSPPVGQLASVDSPLDGGTPSLTSSRRSRRRHLGRPWRYVDLHFPGLSDCADEDCNSRRLKKRQRAKSKHRSFLNCSSPLDLARRPVRHLFAVSAKGGTPAI